MTKECEDRKCNGWTNYETWAVKLWFDNEEATYRNWMERARSWKGREDDARQFAEELEEAVREVNPLSDESSLYADLMSAALSEVDWLEIARSYLDDVEDEPDGDDGEDETSDGAGDAESLFGPVIFAYTRSQALADGELVDVTETAREAGFKVPAALTRAVWAQYVEVPEGVEGQDEAGRLWDILWMCRMAARFKVGPSTFLLDLHVKGDDRPGEGILVTLKAVCGPDDDGSPCVTIMLPEED